MTVEHTSKEDRYMKAILALCRSLAVMSVTVSAMTSFGAKVSKSVPKGWIEDFELAKKTAAAEGKHIFLAFSGSDWCGWCIKLEKEVYSQTSFISQTKDRFVLTMIDCPQNQEILSKLAQKQNKALARTFGVSGYPTGFVCDSTGKTIGRIGGYVKGGPDAYAERMLSLIGAAKGKPAKATLDEGGASMFSWGVPMGALITAAGKKDASAVVKLTEKKIAANKAAIGKIELALKAVAEAKTEAEAKRAIGGFQAAVKSYHRKYVGDYGKWPLSATELAGEQVSTASASVKAVEAVTAAVSNERVKAVYEKRLAVLRADEAKARANYDKLTSR